jgi:hypothetical protein
VKLTKHLTFSNVIALIALFLALGGTVYAAGKISGSQVKPNSLPGNRVKKGTLTGNQVKANSLTGKQISESSLAGVSASSLASVQYVSAAVTLAETTGPGDQGTSGTATCPAGTKVIGGGATLSEDAEAYVNDSGPTSTRDGWSATAYAFKSGLTMTVTAICTSVTATTG